MAKKRTTESPHPPVDLDDRKAAILKAVVTEHIDTAQPVGSGSVVQSGDVKVSSATIRSEMVALERDGYLTQPHTSAGRIPTDKGYRYFVDHLEHGKLSGAKQMELASFFSNLRGETEEILEKTSRLMSRLTPYPSVVVAPSHVSALIVKAQIIDMGPHRAVAVVVLSDGAVVRRNVGVDVEVSESDVREASDTFHALLVGTTLDQVVEVSPRDSTVARLVRAAVAEVHEAVPVVEGDRVFIGGPARVAEAFDTVEAVREVLSVLEQELVVVSLIEDMMRRGISVAIGNESGYESLAAAAVIVAPLTIDGLPAGAVGLLGPTRMNYPEALAVAESVSTELSKHLGVDRDG